VHKMNSSSQGTVKNINDINGISFNYTLSILFMNNRYSMLELLARHSSVKTTQKYYHGNRTTLKDILNRRGKVIELERKKG
jgi:integrase